MARILESVSIAGPAGRLESLHEAPEDGRPIERVAVFCHPHPLHGATMHNKVVYRMARAARSAGSAVVRFNFRGVGTSDGAYDEGRGEQDDLRAVLAYAKDRYPGLPLVVGGFSFGSRVALRVACTESRVERVVAVGAPVDHGSWDFLARCACPKWFLHATHDEFGARSTFERVFSHTGEPKRVDWIEARDHFFSDALDELEQAARRAAAEAF